MAVSHLLYLHGFRSSPQSMKARLVAQWMAEHRPDITLLCPQLPPSPEEALRDVLREVATWPASTSAVIGSSLGGYYATVVAERLGWHAALLNPAVDPARDLAAYIGRNKAWHSDEAFYFQAHYVDELRAMRPSGITHPERYLAVIAKGDEVLDWREMSACYAAARLMLLEGSDHALSEFASLWPAVRQFLGIEDHPPA